MMQFCEMKPFRSALSLLVAAALAFGLCPTAVTTAYADPAAEAQEQAQASEGAMVEYQAEDGSFTLQFTVDGSEACLTAIQTEGPDTCVVVPEEVPYTDDAGDQVAIVTSLGERCGQLDPSSTDKPNNDIAALSVPFTVRTIGKEAFANCAELKSIEWRWGASVNGGELDTAPLVETIGAYAFSRSGLESIDLSECKNMALIGYGAFYSCTGLEKLVLADHAVTIEVYQDGAFYGLDGLTELIVPEGCTEVDIASSSLQSLDIPSSVVSLKFVNRCFSQHTSDGTDTLKTITFADRYDSLLVSLTDCYGLTDLVLPEGTKRVNLFGCRGLENVVAPQTVTDLSVTWGTSLRSITCLSPELYLDIVQCSAITSMEFNPEGRLYCYSFDCSDEPMEKLVLPDAVYKMGTGVLAFPFQGLESFDLPSTTSDVCFRVSPATLREVRIKESSALEWLQSSFIGYKVLEEVSLPEGLTSLTRNSFTNNEKLRLVRFMSKDVDVEAGCFENNPTLEEIHGWGRDGRIHQLADDLGVDFVPFAVLDDNQSSPRNTTVSAWIEGEGDSAVAHADVVCTWTCQYGDVHTWRPQEGVDFTAAPADEPGKVVVSAVADPDGYLGADCFGTVTVEAARSFIGTATFRANRTPLQLLREGQVTVPLNPALTVVDATQDADDPSYLVEGRDYRITSFDQELVDGYTPMRVQGVGERYAGSVTLSVPGRAVAIYDGEEALVDAATALGCMVSTLQSLRSQVYAFVPVRGNRALQALVLFDEPDSGALLSIAAQANSELGVDAIDRILFLYRPTAMSADAVLRSVGWEWMKPSLEGIALAPLPRATFTGAPQIPTIASQYAPSVPLMHGADYALSYRTSTGQAVDQPVNAGTYEVVVQGAGCLRGSATLSLSISPASLSNASIRMSSTPTSLAQVAAYVTVACNGRTLSGGTDYSYAATQNGNTVLVTITGKGNYTGVATQSFTLADPPSAVVPSTPSAPSVPTVTPGTSATAPASSSPAKPSAQPSVTKLKTPTVKFSSAKVTKAYGSKAFTQKLSCNSAGAKTYTSSNKKVAVVNAKTGKVTLKGVGNAVIKVTVAAKGAYASKSASYTLTVTPKKQVIKKVKAAKKAMTVSYTKDAKATGYQIQYSTSKKFTSKTTKTVKVKKRGTVSKKISKLKSKKKYYVRVRSYTTVGKATYYGSWSKTKSVKVK